MTSFYDGIVELYKTFDIKDANDHLARATQEWVMVKVAEVDVPVEGSAGTYLRREVAYVLGRHKPDFPPAPPVTSGPAKPDDRITQPQLDYIKSLEKRSTANSAAIVKYLDNKRKSMLDLTKAEAGELINRLAK